MAPSARPIDFAHLYEQTMGDRALEQEVLSLFAHQANAVAEQIGAADRRERLRLAHQLKGAARGIGAFAIADCLEEVQRNPDDDALLARLKDLITDAVEAIASVSR